MEGKQKYGKMQEHDLQRRKWEKVGKQRRKYYKNAGNESKSMGKCRIEITGNGMKAMETWKAKMQDMSWEAKEMRSKCRNPGNSDDCKIYDF